MNRRQRKRQARLKKMLDTAMAIVQEEGLDALTVSRLADELDVAVGGLYRYFDSKEALLVELECNAVENFHETVERVLELADAYVAQQDLDGRDAAMCKMLIGVTTYIEDARLAPGSHRLIEQVVATPDKLLTDEQALSVNQVIEPLLARFSTLISEAAEAGALDDHVSALQRTHVLWAALHGLDHFRKRDRIVEPEELQVDALMQVMLRTLLRGWGADADNVDALFVHVRAFWALHAKAIVEEANAA